MSEAPDRIWLHRRDPEDGFGAESTWSEDQIEDWDVEYIRADIHDRRADRLRAELAEREANVEKLRAELRAREAQVMSLEKDREAAGDAYLRMHDIQSSMIGMAQQIQQAPEQRGTISGRTDAEWKAADRRKRINDLAARYAGEIAAGMIFAGANAKWGRVVEGARALAAAVVEAEE